MESGRLATVDGAGAMSERAVQLGNGALVLDP